MNHQTLSHSQPQDDEKATLLIRHLPEAIPLDILSRLLSHYGSSTVRPCSGSGSRIRNSAFVDFNSKALASQAQQQLNGLRFLGKVLSVEQATKQAEDGSNLHNSTHMAKESADSSVKHAAAPPNLSSQGSTLASEPIAQGLGVEYPFPPHLEYAYPPPDGNILTNIVNALIAVPRFYTQVLHLMNKMNIPAPFRAALPTPPLPNLVPAPPPVPPPSAPPPPPVLKGSTMGDTSSSESDMSSSDEDAVGKAEPKKKRTKREAILGPALNKDVAHEAVGLRPSALLPKEMPIIKKKNPVLQIKIAPKQIQSEQISIGDASQLEDIAEEVSRQERYATAEELKNGKLPPEELLSKPMFKSYAAGNPSPVLYIKNLAKDVVADDFYFIFGSLFGSIDAAKSSLCVKLMQEGRMRGQAFVTFPTIELAADALNLANGYVFKGKPIVIQFGRNQVN